MQEKQILKAISALEKRVVDLYHRVRAGVGIQGPQGVQGPLGPPGPVGPAGLEWQGQWVSGTSYIADDAVGYNGASYFCILATSGTTTPNLATSNWALLASQGAIGPQGVQGPTGSQGIQGATGPAGTIPVGTRGLIYGSSTTFLNYIELTYDNNIINNGSVSSLFKLPISSPIGKEVIIDVSGNNCQIYGPTPGNLAFETGIITSSGQITANFNDLIKFTSIGSDFWLVEYLQRKPTSKIYRASINETSGGPVLITEFENTLGGPVTLVNDSFGFKLTSAGLFTNSKTFVPAVTYQGNGLVYSLFPTILSTSQIIYESRQTSTNGYSTAFSNALINLEVLVYN